MKKILILFFIMTTTGLYAQTVKLLNGQPIVVIKDSTGIYNIGLDKNSLKNDLELIEEAKTKLIEIKNLGHNYLEMRKREMPTIDVILDLIYLDLKNGTRRYVELIDSINAKYPQKQP
ncbi:MAG: hypothetical protein AB1432_11585 [Bacteroidota bacterium]|jgi:hypothetical protein